jgi:hypothetical protein
MYASGFCIAGGSYHRPMPMILPERTVDAWTASYITGRRWRARLWAPTERRPGERYDLAVGLGNVSGMPVPAHSEVWPDKVFVLEHKGVDEASGGRSVIWLRLRQLLDHLYEDRARGGSLVYYLLPDPDWNSFHPAPYGSLPDVAWRRTPGPKLPSGGRAWEGFQRWAHVVQVEEVHRYFERIRRIEPGRLKQRDHGGRADWVCALEMPEVRALRGRVSLRDFLSGVRRCTHGRIASEKRLRERRPDAADPYSDRLGSTLDSLDEALGAASGERAEDEEVGREEQEDMDLPDEPDDRGLAEIVSRPAFTTVYGVGDSRQMTEEVQRSSLF